MGHAFDIVGINNTIAFNRIWNNTDGVLLDMANQTMIVDNNILNSREFGVWMIDGAENNTLCGNTIQNNYVGIALGPDAGSNNLFYHNNILGSIGNQVTMPLNSLDVWDDGYPSGGNYWSDYNGTDLRSGPSQNVTGSDGIGDTQYVIDSNNIDHYPLMGAFYNFSVHLHTPPYNVTVISNSTITGFVTPISLENPQMSISFNATGRQGSTGFCRVSIPTAMMNGTYQVFVNGTEIPYTLLPCSNATASYLYFTYKQSTEQVSIVPEFPSFLILPLLMMITLLGAIILKRKRNVKK
jgi:parallel beta-helix repeat protein